MPQLLSCNGVFLFVYYKLATCSFLVVCGLLFERLYFEREEVMLVEEAVLDNVGGEIVAVES